jgi:hypothetical protein
VFNGRHFFSHHVFLGKWSEPRKISQAMDVFRNTITTCRGVTATISSRHCFLLQNYTYFKLAAFVDSFSFFFLVWFIAFCSIEICFLCALCFGADLDALALAPSPLLVFKSNQIKSNQIKSNQIKSNQTSFILIALAQR